MISPIDTTNTTAKSTTTGSGRVSAADQQDRFLKLLVTQMRNQDPLNPMDNAQLTTQLAQISTVSGVDTLNETMKSLIGQIQGMQALQSNSLIGRDVMVSGDRLALAKGAATGAVELVDGADDAVVSVRAENGEILATIPLGKVGPGITTFTWDGKTTAGLAAADGSYKFTVDAQAEGKSVSATALAIGHVEKVVRNTNGVQFDLGVLGTRSIDDVKQIY